MSKIKDRWFWMGWISAFLWTHAVSDYNGQAEEIRFIQEHWLPTWSWRNLAMYALGLLAIGLLVASSAKAEAALKAEK